MRYAIENIMIQPVGAHGVKRLSARYFQDINPLNFNAAKDIEDTLYSIGENQSNILKMTSFRGDGILFYNDRFHINFVPKWTHIMNWVTIRSSSGIEKFPVASKAQYAFELEHANEYLHNKVFS